MGSGLFFGPIGPPRVLGGWRRGNFWISRERGIHSALTNCELGPWAVGGAALGPAGSAPHTTRPGWPLPAVLSGPDPDLNCSYPQLSRLPPSARFSRSYHGPPSTLPPRQSTAVWLLCFSQFAADSTSRSGSRVHPPEDPASHPLSTAGLSKHQSTRPTSPNGIPTLFAAPQPRRPRHLAPGQAAPRTTPTVQDQHLD